MFFFFKQKAADEMLISDWSSDVCSSDLKFPAWRRARARHLGTSSPRKRGPSGFGFKATGKSENHLQNQRLDPRLRGDDGLAKPRLSAGQSVTSTTATTGRRRRRGPSSS